MEALCCELCRSLKSQFFVSILSLILGVFIINPAFAEDLQNARVFIDSSGQKSLAQIQSLPESAWQDPPRAMYFGITADTVWLRFHVPDNLQIQQPWLRSVRSNLDHLCVYSQQNQHWNKNCQGTLEPLDQSSYIAADLLFPLINKNSLHYVSAQSKSILILPLELLDSVPMMKEVQRKQASEWLAIGVILATCLYNLVVFALLRDQIFLIHALSSIFFTIYWFGFVMGHSRLLSQNVYSTIYLLSYALVCLSAFFALEGIQRVALNPENRGWHKLFRIFQIWSLIGVLMMIPQWRTLVLAQLNITNLLLPCLFFVLWLDQVRQRQWASVAYISTWLIYSFSMLLIALGFMGMVPFSIHTMHLFSWTYAVPMLLLSWLLVLRVRHLRKEQRHLLLTQMQLIQNYSHELEDKVKQRTLELETALSELSKNNHFKDKLFSVLAHDLRSPFSSLQTMLHLFERQTLSTEQVQNMLPRMRNHLDGIYTSLENLLNWARHQMRENIDNPQLIDPQMIIQEMIDLYAAAAEQKGLSLRSQFEAKLLIRVDPDQLRIILRNLINNAIKFTPNEGEVCVSIIQQHHEAVLIIEDTGMGINPGQQHLIQQGDVLIAHHGTEGEKGMGIGLELCRSYLQQNGGRWEIESRPNQGTRFILYFPVASESLSSLS